FKVPRDASQHRSSFRGVQKLVREVCGVEIDEKGVDEARLCFMSFDPNIYENENAIEIEPLPEPEKPRRPVNANADLSEGERIAAELLQCGLEWSAKKNGYFVRCPGIALHTTAHNAKECIVYLNGSPTIDCKHTSCSGVVEGANRVLRSRIGKAECQHPGAPRIESNSVDVNEAEPPQLPPSYIAPPLELLPRVLRNYVIAAAKSRDVDISFVFLPQLSAISTAIGNSRSLLVKRDYVQPPIIWTGTLGRVGSGKSPGT